MKAAVLTKLNAPLKIMELSLPGLDYGQVLVRVLVSGICGAQLQEIAGHKGNAGNVPHLLGHEGAGIVERVGRGVTRVKEGDKVVMHWRKAAGIEAAFPRYEAESTDFVEIAAYAFGKPYKISGGGERKFVGGGKVTTLSEYSIVSENRVTPVPHDTPNALCALLGCSLSTALGTVERDASVKQGESVLIIGAGGLGANLIRCCSMANAYPIVSVDVHDSKKRLAMNLGATRYINSKKELITGDYDVVVDTSGSPNAIEKGFLRLKPSGRFIMVGQPKPGESVTIPNARSLFDGEGKTLKATQGGGFQPDIDIPRYLNMFKSGALQTDGIITHWLPLKRINEAIERVRKGGASRIIIDMSL